jgi:hypothetical protein
MGKALVKRTKRRSRNYTAWITLQDGHTRVKCRVFDISAGGAKIICDKADDLRDRFVLASALTAAKSRTCEIVWRRGRTLGIKYTD